MALFEIVIITVMAGACLAQSGGRWTIYEPAVANRLVPKNGKTLAATCDETIATGATMTAYPGTCNMFLLCDRGSGLIYIFTCGQGTYFNNGGKYCDYPWGLKPSDCDGTGNPCRPGYKLPDKTDGCVYYECPSGGPTVRQVCLPGTGFDFSSSSCATSASGYCTTNMYNETRAVCQPITGTTAAYNRTVYEWKDTLGRIRNDSFSVIVGCPANTVYLSNSTDCYCTVGGSMTSVCADKQLVNLDSATGSWSASARADPGYYKLEGNLTLEITGTYSGQAFIQPGNPLSNPVLSQNTLGGRWNITGTFTYGNKVSGVFQNGLPANTPNSPDISLLENGGCNTTATWSIRLRPSSSTSGSIVVTINGRTVSSSPVPVTSSFTVSFSRSDTVGRLDVSSGGTQLDTKAFSFAQGEEVAANPCPMSIGSGWGQQPYTGYADKIHMFKYAC